MNKACACNADIFVNITARDSVHDNFFEFSKYALRRWQMRSGLWNGSRRYVKVNVKVHYTWYSAIRSKSPPQKRSDMARVLKGFHSFTCTPTRSSAIGMSQRHRSWHRLTLPNVTNEVLPKIVRRLQPNNRLKTTETEMSSAAASRGRLWDGLLAYGLPINQYLPYISICRLILTCN